MVGMSLGIADSYSKANHNPIAVVNGIKGKDVVYLQADGKQKITLSAKGSSDPDGDDIDVKWWIYPEASTAKGAALSSLQGEDTDVDLSGIKQQKGAVHVILQIHDDGTPMLYTYRRMVIQL